MCWITWAFLITVVKIRWQFYWFWHFKIKYLFCRVSRRWCRPCGNVVPLQLFSASRWRKKAEVPTQQRWAWGVEPAHPCTPCLAPVCHCPESSHSQGPQLMCWRSGEGHAAAGLSHCAAVSCITAGAGLTGWYLQGLLSKACWPYHSELCKEQEAPCLANFAGKCATLFNCCISSFTTLRANKKSCFSLEKYIFIVSFLQLELSSSCLHKL